jgi:hypothetical protein
MSHGISRSNTIWRYILPYCFQKVEAEGYKHVYIPLNRDYKPLGHFRNPHGKKYVDYSEYPHQFVRFKRDPSTFKGVWWKTEPALYLYDDGEESRKTYFKRLERLTAFGELLIDQVVTAR